MSSQQKNISQSELLNLLFLLSIFHIFGMCVLRKTRMICTNINVRLCNGMDVRSSSNVRLCACGRLATRNMLMSWYTFAGVLCVHTVCICVSVPCAHCSEVDVHVCCLVCRWLSICVLVRECECACACACVSMFVCQCRVDALAFVLFYVIPKSTDILCGSALL